MRCPHMIPNNNNPNFDLYLPTNQIICVQCIKKHPQKVPLKTFDYFAASGEPFVKCPNMTIATFFKLVFYESVKIKESRRHRRVEAEYESEEEE